MAQNEILLRLKGTSDFSDIQSDVKTLQEYFKGLKLPKGLTKNLEQSLEGLDKELVTFQQHMNSGFKTKGDITGLEKSGQKIIQTFEKIQKTIDGLDTSDLKSMFSSEFNQLKEIEGKISVLGKSIKKNFSGKINIGADKVDKQIVDIQEALNTLYKTSTTKKFKLLQNAVDAGDIQQIRAVINELKDYEKTSLQARVNNEGIVTREAKSNLTAFHNALETVDVIIKKIGQNPQFKMQLQDMEALKQQAAQLGITLDQKVLDVLEEMRGAVGNLPETFEDVNRSILGTAQSQQQLNSELSQVKEHITQFFSLINVAQLLRRAFQDVYNTVKELDAVMTETAVVTDFSIGDMWDKLPEYTAQAKALGVATKDLYAATTLYYQQGLDTNASMAAGVETMKMARIAGMEATQATDAMTAALRGFNMEVNEMNAQNVNDVYSKLAAITASDTKEIATAMSKTAAIANSVGAEFENIAVFLAQGIETTRESADAIGTAMKTILARFNEMKKDPSEIGEIDGEIVDANKVETALRSVGIALRDTNGEFRNADQVLLEVAEKWDSMSVMQQRYIATTAAGSRQQSRFIAFMQDYNRTLELQEAAYNADGAAQQQYEKTLESLESKLAKLRDAWDEFILGIANSDGIKIAIDALSTVLDIINKLTTFSDSLSSGMMKIFVAFSLFKGAKTIFNYFITQISQTFLRAGQEAGTQFKTGLEIGLSKLKTSTPIFGTISKQTKLVSNSIKAMSQSGKINLNNFAESLKNVGVEVRRLSTEGLNDQLFTSLTQQLSEVGSFTVAGEEWAQDLVNGFVQSLNSGVEVDDALNNFENKIKTGLNDTNIFNKNNSNNTSFNVRDIKIDPTQGLNKLGEQNYQKKIQGISTALSTMGMVLSAIGNEMTELDGAAGKVGDAMSYIGSGAATAGMTLSGLSSAASALGISLSTGPLIAITAVVTALSLAITAFQKYKKHAEEVRQAEVEAATTANKETEANRDLYKSLEDTMQGYKDGINSREDVAEASEELVEKYGLESLAVNDLTNDYKRLTQAIRDKRLEEEKENVEKQEGGKASAREQIFASGLSNLASVSTGPSTKDEVSDVSTLQKESQEILENLQLDKIISIGQNGMLIATKAWSSFTDQELSNLSSFLTQYLSIYGQILRKEGKKIENSEIYSSLQSIINNTSESFSAFNSSLDAYTQSIIEYGRLLYEEQSEEINSREDYFLEREKFIEQLEKIGVTGDIAEQAADDYFLSNDATKDWVQAEKYVAKIEAEVSGDKTAIDIYQKYLNGEIPPEVFISYMVKIDFEKTGSSDEINKAVGQILVENLANASNTFYTAGEEIRNYVSENFSLEGIDETVLQEFETNLAVINDALPDGIDLMGAWQEALSKGTVGITKFFAVLQNYLNEASFLTQKKALNALIYGVSDVEDFKKEYESQGIAGADENTRTEFAEKYGIDLADLDDVYAFVGKPVKEQRAELEQDLEDTKAEGAALVSDLEDDQTTAYGQSGYVTQNADGTLTFKPPDAEDATGGLAKQYADADAKYDAAATEANAALYDYNTAKEDSEHVSGMEILDFIASLSGKYGPAEISTDVSKTTTEKIEYDNAQAAASTAKEARDTAKEAFEDAEFEITDEIEEFNEQLTIAEDKLKAFEQYEGLLQNLEINAEIKNAHQIAEFENQLTRIKELTNGKDKVDFETFQQLQKIMPEMTAQASYVGDGMFDISAGMAMVTEQEQEYADGIKQSTEARLQQELGEEQAYYNKLLRLKDQLQAVIDGTGSEAELNEALTEVVTDGQFEQAKAADQAQDDMSNSSNEGASNVLSDIASMDLAYQQLGQTISQVHDAMLNLGAEGYTVNITTHVTQSNSGPTNNTEPDEGLYEVDGESADEMANAIAEGRASAEDMMASVDKALAGSLGRIGNLQGALGALGSSTNVDSDGSGGGGGSSKELEDIDSLYNLLRRIESIQQKRSILQKEYNELLQDEDATLEDIQKKQAELVDNLYKELILQQTLKESRLQQIRDEQETNSDLNKYVWYDEELGTVQINQELINSVTDEDLRKQIDERISNFEKWDKDIDSAESKSLEYEQQLKELLEQGETSLDESVNTLEKINEFERDRNKLEEEHNRLLNQQKITQGEIYESLSKQAEAYEAQIKYQAQLAEERKKQYEEFLADNADVSKYYTYDEATGEHTVDWDAINALGSQDVIDWITGKVEEAIELEEQMEEANDNLSTIQTDAEEFYENSRKEQISFFDRIKEAILTERQKEIDQLSLINDSINNVNADLMESIQKSLNDQRQARDNAEIEEDISDKEARLAYLQADTTGANDLEIKNLQKELEEQREDYTDTLIDQKISELQEQNDEAAAQRERQIELAQAQLDYYSQSGEVWKTVDWYLKNPEEIRKLLASAEDRESLSEQGKQDFDDDVTQAIDNSDFTNDTENSLSEHGVDIGSTGTVDVNGVIRDDATYIGDNKVSVTGVGGGSYVYSGAAMAPSGEEWLVDDEPPEFIMDPNQKITAADARVALRIAAQIASPNELKYDPRFYDANGDGEITASDARMLLRTAAKLESDNFIKDGWYTGADVNRVREILSRNIKPTKTDYLDYDFNKDGVINAADARTLMNMDYINETIVKPSWLDSNGLNSMPPEGANVNKWYKDWYNARFKTGGLADFTGPAWLDGSKSRPELVLNAQDTQNFIQLKDVLSSVMKNIGSKNSDEKTGDVYYEIHIDVEKLTSDYDVDDVANRVKTIISQDAMYRNTNIINRLR